MMIQAYPIAGKAALGKLILIAGDTDNIIILGDEALTANGLLAHQAAETVLMPLLVLVLKLLHT
jgi:D-serine deaminase-like pyridoxal phosphate-dependent protein